MVILLSSCTSWHEQNLESYKRQGPVENEAVRITTTFGEVYQGRAKKGADPEQLVLELNQGIILTIPFKSIGKVEIFGPVY